MAIGGAAPDGVTGALRWSGYSHKKLEVSSEVSQQAY